jgi:signal transduction histidine kinase
VDTLETLAAQAAVAIINARLFQQSDLIAEMVHELRTPLAALTATSHILARADLPIERRLEFISTIREETDRLTRMTTEFLDLAKLESGRARFDRQPFEIGELVHECVAVVIPQADSREIAIHEQMFGLPPVIGDRGKIKQVLLNLLTNAIKYNREGGHIHVSGQNEAGRLRVAVRDTGKGIPPESLPRIFEKFYRVPDSEGWSQGTGLGLAIAKRIAESHGGKMLVESTVDVGTTFSFTLPLHIEGEPRPAAD